MEKPSKEKSVAIKRGEKGTLILKSAGEVKKVAKSESANKKRETGTGEHKQMWHQAGNKREEALKQARRLSEQAKMNWSLFAACLVRGSGKDE
jgi:hypothetical protein